MESILNYSDDEETDNLQQVEAAALKDLEVDPKFKLMVQQLESHLSTFENPSKFKDFCHICQKTLKSTIHAKTHYVSVKHQEKFTSFLYEKTEVLKSAAVRLPEMYWDTEIPKELITPQLKISPVPEQRSNVDAKVPDLENFPQKGMQFLQRIMSPEILSRVMKVDGKQIFCRLCSVQLRDIGSCRSHVLSKKHQKKVANTIETLSVIKEESSRVEVDDFSKWPVCHLCQIPFTDTQSMDKHILEFPHNTLSKMKSEVIGKEVPHAQYWIVENKAINCTLCDVMMFGETQATMHLVEASHKKLFSEWCQNVLTLELNGAADKRHFYCGACAVYLDGTSGAVEHYESEDHLRMMVKREDVEEVSKKTVQEVIFAEVNKLVETIYYSKKIPYEFGLKYMRLLNGYLESCR